MRIGLVEEAYGGAPLRTGQHLRCFDAVNCDLTRKVEGLRLLVFVELLALVRVILEV